MTWVAWMLRSDQSITLLGIALLVVHALGAVYTVVWWWALYRRVIGRPVGPSREFAARLGQAPQTPPPPPDPNREVWKPWFRLYGPRFLELKYGAGLTPATWQAWVHELAAYRLYGEDRLREAIEAAERALKCGARPGLWTVKLWSIATAELEARESAIRVEKLPFIFELPAGDRQYDALTSVSQACSARVESLLGFQGQPTMFALLPEQQLRRDAGSPWGYLARKQGFSKICLLRASGAGLADISIGLVHEYVRLALWQMTRGRAPRWLIEGLAQWISREVLEHAPEAPEPARELRRLRASERALELLVRRSALDSMADRGATARRLVQHLIDTYGEPAMRQFVTRLASGSEGSAFHRAFGLPQRRFARQWASKRQQAA